MQYKLELNLKHMAAVSFATSLWEMKLMKDENYQLCISNFSPFSIDECNLYDVIETLLEDSETIVSTLPLERQYKLYDAIKEIGLQIQKWLDYIERHKGWIFCNKCNAGKFKMFWTPYGTIDEVRIYQSHCVYNATFDMVGIHNNACDSLLKECRMRSEGPFWDVVFWKYYRNNDWGNIKLLYQSTLFSSFWKHDYSIDENMLLLVVFEGLSIAVPYLWEKLSEEQRDKVIVDCAYLCLVRYNNYINVNYYESKKFFEIYLFLQHQMTLNDKKTLFEGITRGSNIKYVILAMFLLQWPWQDLLTTVFVDMLQYLESDCENVVVFLIMLLQKIYTDDLFSRVERKYFDMFEAICNDMPGSLKHQVVIIGNTNLLSSIRISCPYYYDIIKIIFFDLEIKHLKQICPEISKLYAKMLNPLISLEGFKLIDQLITTFDLEEEKKSFYLDAVTLEECIQKQQYDIVSKILAWFCNTKEEKEYQKSKINHTRICHKYLIKNQHESLNEFLVWRFDKNDVRQKYRDLFKNEMFSMKWFYAVCNNLERRDYLDKSYEPKFDFHPCINQAETIKIIEYFKNVDLIFRINIHSYSKIIDDISSLCSFSEIELRQFKQVIVYRIVRSMCEKFVRFYSMDGAEKFVRWAFTDGEEMESFIKEFITSYDGVLFCSQVIKNCYMSRVMSCRNVITNKAYVPSSWELADLIKNFIDFWIRPLDDFDEFQRNLSSFMVDLVDASEIASYKLFMDLLKDARPTLVTSA
uniref:Uncharacterized protein n=1 Tax=Clastoptera arizonana TaxID=38151 RepID=A0A1B6D1R7_9HEMI